MGKKKGMLKCLGSCTVLWLLIFAGPLFSEDNDCINIAENTPVTGIHSNANLVRFCIFDDSGKPQDILLNFDLSEKGKWSPTPDQIAKIANIINIKRKVRSQIRLEWMEATAQAQNTLGYGKFVIASEKCAESYPADSLKDEQSDSSKSTDRDQKRSSYEQEIAKKKDIYWILLDENLNELNWSKDFYPSQGNPIYVSVLFKKEDMPKFSIEFSPCSLEQETPSVFIHDESIFNQLQKESPKIEYEIHEFPPRPCWNDTVTIKVNMETRDGRKEKSLILNQYRKYRATLQMGVLLSGLQETSFGVRETDGKKVIYNGGPENNGPVYTASVILYSFPKYLKGIFGGQPYKGRDIVNDWDLLDRLGGVIGVGLTTPTRCFVSGFSFDVFYGVSVFLVREWALLKELADVKEGDSFSGEAEDIPIRNYWDGKWTFGISLDLRYVTALFQRK